MGGSSSRPFGDIHASVRDFLTPKMTQNDHLDNYHIGYYD
jgi:hypothetical protein